MSATAPNYNHTVTACFVGYITQAVINNFMPVSYTHLTLPTNSRV